MFTAVRSSEIEMPDPFSFFLACSTKFRIFRFANLTMMHFLLESELLFRAGMGWDEAMSESCILTWSLFMQNWAMNLLQSTSLDTSRPKMLRLPLREYCSKLFIWTSSEWILFDRALQLLPFSSLVVLSSTDFTFSWQASIDFSMSAHRVSKKASFCSIADKRLSINFSMSVWNAVNAFFKDWIIPTRISIERGSMEEAAPLQLNNLRILRILRVISYTT